MDKREFYAAVAAVLGVEDEYVEQLPYVRRWGQRSLGNGRYPGFGLVRWFSESLIHLLREGKSIEVFETPEAALDRIRNITPRSSIGQDASPSS